VSSRGFSGTHLRKRRRWWWVENLAAGAYGGIVAILPRRDTVQSTLLPRDVGERTNDFGDAAIGSQARLDIGQQPDAISISRGKDSQDFIADRLVSGDDARNGAILCIAGRTVLVNRAPSGIQGRSTKKLILADAEQFHGRVVAHADLAGRATQQQSYRHGLQQRTEPFVAFV
jgi:hypothetical protein